MMLATVIMWIMIVVAVVVMIRCGNRKATLTWEKEEKGNQAKEGKKSEVKGKQKSLEKAEALTREKKIERLSVAMEMLSVFIGAVLALVLTVHSTSQQETDKLIENLNVARSDLSTQALLIQDALLFYGENADEEILYIETSADLTLLFTTIYSDEGVEKIPASALGCMVSNSRSIEAIDLFHQKNVREGTFDRYLVDETVAYLDYIVEELGLVIEYLEGELSKKEFEAALTEHVYEIMNENNLLYPNS